MLGVREGKSHGEIEEGTNIPCRLVDTAAAYSVNVVQSIPLRHFCGRDWPAVFS